MTIKRVSVPSRPGLDPGDDALDPAPALGAVVEFLEAPHLAARRGGPEALGGGFLQRLDMAAQHRVGGQAEQPIHPVGATPIEDFRGGIVAVGTQQDLDPGPSGADRTDEAAKEGADLTPARALARPQQRGHEAALAVEDDNRLEAVIVVIGVEQAQLLAAMHAVEGVVDIKDDALWHLPKRGAVLLDQRPAQAQAAPEHPAGSPAARSSIASIARHPRATGPAPA